MAATPEELRLYEKIIRAKVRLEGLKRDHSVTCRIAIGLDGSCTCGAGEHNAAVDAVLKELATVR